MVNLSIHFEYDETYEVVIGDLLGLQVSHIDSLVIQTSTCTFHLDRTFRVPSIRKNLISAHHFTSQNKFFIKFHPFISFRRIRSWDATMFNGVRENGVYRLPNSLVDSKKMVANMYE